MKDLVSVIITTYKRSNMLDRAIESVLKQTYSYIEIIVVDDNEPASIERQKTEKKMKKYENLKNVKYIKHAKNKNGAAARNTGIRNAVGKFVTYLDDDDFYYESKVEKEVTFLLENPKYHAVYCGWFKDEKVIEPTISGNMTYELLSGEQIIITNTIMMYKDISLEIGGWDESFRRNQEAAYLLRFFNHGYMIGVLSEVLVEFDSSDNSNRSNPHKNEEDFRYYLSFHQPLLNEFPDDIQRKIITKRMLGVLLNYLKHRNLKDVLRLYMEMIKNFPIQFHKELILYFMNR